MGKNASDVMHIVQYSIFFCSAKFHRIMVSCSAEILQVKFSWQASCLDTLVGSTNSSWLV